MTEAELLARIVVDPRFSAASRSSAAVALQSNRCSACSQRVIRHRRYWKAIPGLLPKISKRASSMPASSSDTSASSQ